MSTGYSRAPRGSPGPAYTAAIGSTSASHGARLAWLGAVAERIATSLELVTYVACAPPRGVKGDGRL
jgi:hypothetical protein